MTRVGLVGGRGYVGEELLRLLLPHPDIELAFAVSRSLAGQALTAVHDGLPDCGLEFTALSAAEAAGQDLDLLVLALGNGEAAAWVEAFDAAGHPAAILDISADYRHHPDWVYGLPEQRRDALAGARRVANPGCYATAAMLALWPVREHLASAPSLFGVSGYSGAGRSPSPRNDPQRLADNLVPYRLTGHVHEAEVSHQLGREVRFMPHVAGFFRGLSMTVSMTLRQELELAAIYARCYADEPLVELSDEPPELAAVRGTARAAVGGWCLDARDPRRAVVVSVIDNLGKGAATQALQNLNLMCGQPELTGLSGDRGGQTP